MIKTFVVLLAVAVCSTLAQVPGDHRIDIKGGFGIGRPRSLYTAQGTRLCVCLANTKVDSIQGFNAGSIKVFSSSDCTGNYQAFTGDATVNAQWAKSVVFGGSGFQRGPNGCPNLFA